MTSGSWSSMAQMIRTSPGFEIFFPIPKTVIFWLRVAIRIFSSIAPTYDWARCQKGMLSSSYHILTLIVSSILSPFSLLSDILLDDKNSALQLVKRLDYRPLAMTQAGSYIFSTGMTESNYLSRFKKAGAWADYSARMSLIFSTSVDEMFESSYQNVKAKDHDALNLLVLVSFMAAENVPGVVLEVGSNRSGIHLIF